MIRINITVELHANAVRTVGRIYGTPTVYTEFCSDSSDTPEKLFNLIKSREIGDVFTSFMRDRINVEMQYERAKHAEQLPGFPGHLRLKLTLSYDQLEDGGYDVAEARIVEPNYGGFDTAILDNLAFRDKIIENLFKQVAESDVDGLIRTVGAMKLVKI